MRRIIFSLFLILVAMSPMSGQAAESQLFVDDLVPFTLHDGEPSRLSLLVHSTGSLGGLRALVKELKDPDGQNLPPTLLEAAIESPQINEQGTHVYLKPELSGFRRPGDYVAVVLLTATPPVTMTAGKPSTPVAVNRLLTVHLRRERASLFAEPLHVKILRPSPWQAAKLSVPYSIENRSSRELHELSLDAQPLRALPHGPRGDGNHDTAATVAGSVTVLLPPPPPGQLLVRPRTGQSLDLPANGQLNFTLLFSDLRGVGRFRSALTMRAPALESPQILQISVEVVDRWEFALLAVALGVGLSALINQLSRRNRKAAENHYRIAKLALELEGMPSVGSRSSATRASFTEKLRRAALRNSDGEATLAAKLLNEIDEELDTFYGAQNLLRASVHERLDRAQQHLRALQAHRATMNADQAARLRQIRSEVERISAYASTEQHEVADTVLGVVADQLQSLARALAVPNPDAPTLHADSPSLLVDDALRIEIHEPASRWWVGDAVRLRLIDERKDQNRPDAPVYIWRFGDGAAEPGATEVEHPLEKAGRIEVQVTVRRPDGSESGIARRTLFVMGLRPEIDLDAAPGPRLRVQYVLTLIALVIAGLSGVYLLCFGTTAQSILGASFGMPQHYLAAVGWGFVCDMLLRGFSDLLVRLSADR